MSRRPRAAIARAPRAATCSRTADSPHAPDPVARAALLASRATAKISNRDPASANRLRVLPFVVEFAHAFSLEAGLDGGVLELSTDGGMTWTDPAMLGVDPGYSRTISTTFGNPHAGRMAYSATSTGFLMRNLVTLDFGTRVAGQSVPLRFRLATDTSVAGTGWNIDEPSTCTARRAPVQDSALISVREAPATSLEAFDRGVCILKDAE